MSKRRWLIGPARLGNQVPSLVLTVPSPPSVASRRVTSPSWNFLSSFKAMKDTLPFLSQRSSLGTSCAGQHGWEAVLQDSHRPAGGRKSELFLSFPPL